MFLSVLWGLFFLSRHLYRVYRVYRADLPVLLVLEVPEVLYGLSALG